MNPIFQSMLLFSAFIVGLFSYRYLSRVFRALTLRRRFSRGAEGEQEALVYLKKHGYTILEQQASRTITLLVDGEPCTCDIRADYIAEKKGKRCLVEVKTGEKAVDPTGAHTRRQLLEYAVSYDVDDVYLFDANRGVLHNIVLPTVQVRYRGGLKPFLAGTAAGAAAVMLFLFFTR